MRMIHNPKRKRGIGNHNPKRKRGIGIHNPKRKRGIGIKIPRSRFGLLDAVCTCLTKDVGNGTA